MTNQLLQSNLWEKVTALATKAKRRYVAVAYLGKGATKLLPLKRGDILVIDMSLTAVRAGETNPHEIELYMNRQVEVYSCSNLHAKVFVFDNKAIIGSSNVSENSRKNLVEAALLTTDKETVRAARGFVHSLTGEHITPAYVDTCKQEYRKEYHPQRDWRKKRTNKPTHPRLWVSRIWSEDEDPNRDEAEKSGCGVAEASLKNKKQYEVETLSITVESRFNKTVELGDLIIEIWCEDGSTLQVFPPSRVVNIVPYRSKRKAKKQLLFLETPKSPKTISWKVFKEVLQKGGLFKVSERIDREITDTHLKHGLLGLWKSWHK